MEYHMQVHLFGWLETHWSFLLVSVSDSLRLLLWEFYLSAAKDIFSRWLLVTVFI